MSSYIESAIVYGMKLSPSSEEKVTNNYTINIMEVQKVNPDIDFISYGSTESDFSGLIIGIKITNGFLDEESCVQSFNMEAMVAEINEIKEDIEKAINMLNLDEETVIESHLITYYY